MHKYIYIKGSKNKMYEMKKDKYMQNCVLKLLFGLIYQKMRMFISKFWYNNT